MSAYGKARMPNFFPETLGRPSQWAASVREILPLETATLESIENTNDDV
jgi:hypothetical protein